MKKLILITVAFLFVLFASTAMADRGYKYNDYRQKSLQGERIERHLATRGAAIERHFNDKALRAAYQGKIHNARHFQTRGQQINRHLKHKGARIHAGHDRRGYHPPHNRHYKGYRYGYYTSRGYRDNSFSVIIRQPGLVFGWGWNH